jgi:hypothetical protein
MKPPTIYGMTEEEWREERESLLWIRHSKLIEAIDHIIKSFHPSVEKP